MSVFSESQVVVAAYDEDTSVLNMRLTDGAAFRVDNAGHAEAMRRKITPGGRISAHQREWLERYRVEARSASYERLMALLRQLRKELRRC